MPNLNYFHSAILVLWTPLRNVAGDSFLNKKMLGGGTSVSVLGDQRGHRVTPVGCKQLIPSTQRGSSLLGTFPNVQKMSGERGLTSALRPVPILRVNCGIGELIAVPWPRLLPQS